jgi:hypothetical protein
MKSFKNHLLLALIISLLLFFGYYRDFVFKNINGLLKAWDYNMTYNLPRSLQFFENYDYDTLLNIKWLLTLLFSIIYLLIAIKTIGLLFENKKYTRITLAAYIAVTMVSALFIATGLIFKNTSETMYEFARYLMGMAQSPVILMVLIPAFKLSEKDRLKTD